MNKRPQRPIGPLAIVVTIGVLATLAVWALALTEILP
jgi:hypothetical protein